MKKITQSYWKAHKSGMPIWKQKNDDSKLGLKYGKLKQSALKKGKFEWDKRHGDTIVGSEKEAISGKIYKDKYGALIITDEGLTIKGTKVFD